MHRRATDILRLPEAVEIAVGIHCLNLVAVGKGKADFGSVSGTELFSLVSALRLKRDPLNIMLRQHRVRYLAHFYIDGISLDRPDGNVLFRRGVNAAGDYLCHLLTAAHYRNAAFLDNGNYFPTAKCQMYVAMYDDDRQEDIELAIDKVLDDNNIPYTYVMGYSKDEAIVVKTYTFEIPEEVNE